LVLAREREAAYAAFKVKRRREFGLFENLEIGAVFYGAPIEEELASRSIGPYEFESRARPPMRSRERNTKVLRSWIPEQQLKGEWLAREPHRVSER
jgi:hypothetical protein